MSGEQNELLRKLENLAKTAVSPTELMEEMARRLHERKARYNWVGFYVLDPKDSNFLLVGPYVGSFSPNVRIPLDTGLCGAAATSGKTVIVDDVTKDPRYLQGSSMVISEIVVPIFAKSKLVAELDIESYFPGTFSRREQEFVEACARVVGCALGSEELD